MIVVGGKHPPLDPSQVRIYLNPPAQPYDQVPLLDAKGAGMGQQAQMNSAVGKLKAQAAEVGANGILLQDTSDAESSVGVGNYFNSRGTFGTGTFTSMKRAEAKAIAIYVHDDR